MLQIFNMLRHVCMLSIQALNAYFIYITRDSLSTRPGVLYIWTNDIIKSAFDNYIYIHIDDFCMKYFCLIALKQLNTFFISNMNNRKKNRHNACYLLVFAAPKYNADRFYDKTDIIQRFKQVHIKRIKQFELLMYLKYYILIWS